MSSEMRIGIVVAGLALAALAAIGMGSGQRQKLIRTAASAVRGS